MKFFGLLALSLLSLPAFAQQTCYVDMVDRYNRVVATFTAYDRPSVCHEGMKECRKAIRLSPHLGGVDCIREQGQPVPQPQPQPHPYPQPQPQPQPHPYPQPQPQPYPHRSVEASALILDLAYSESSPEGQTKVVNELIYQINSPHLIPFIRLCDGTRTWLENSQCLLSGVQRAPREMISEEVAFQAVGQACVKTKSWSAEKSCFANAFRSGRFSSLSYYAQSCEQISGLESASRCYRQLFEVQ